MDFKAIQDAVLSDRFSEAQRSDVKNWINHTYGIVWGIHTWPFKRSSSLVTVTAGTQSVSGLPSDFGSAMSLTRDDGYRLQAIPADLFFDRYYSTVSVITGAPVSYTTINTSVLVGPTPQTTTTNYKLLYTKSFTALSADADVAGVPDEFRMMLVFGASSFGLRLQNDPTWEPLEQAFQSDLAQLKASYGRPTRDNYGSFEFGPEKLPLARDVDTGY